MDGGVIIGLVSIAGGAVFITISFACSDSESKLVIRGTNICYGCLLIILGGVRLIRAGAQRAK